MSASDSQEQVLLLFVFLSCTTSELVYLWLCVMFWKLELDIVSSKRHSRIKIIRFCQLGKYSVNWPLLRDSEDDVSSISPSSELNRLQIFGSLIDIHLSQFSFCRNLEVFESHLGNLPFDIHHALKVNTPTHNLVSTFLSYCLCQ